MPNALNRPVGLQTGRAYTSTWAVHGDAAYAATAQVINPQALNMGANDIFRYLAMMFVELVPFVWLPKPPFRAVGTGGGH